jgi:hypothetical protein
LNSTQQGKKIDQLKDAASSQRDTRREIKQKTEFVENIKSTYLYKRTQKSPLKRNLEISPSQQMFERRTEHQETQKKGQLRPI